ncbi:MAG: hypothetical protein FJ357_01750 [Thaumarchaeota archaeon]|nr:hypothetical protein [Nitrososphaerota archaeon]
MGKVIGTITDIDGSIQTVGVDCGLQGLTQVPFEQLVVQGDVVIYIPKWRLDAQRFLREKGLTIRRLKALIDIVSENDEMKEDAEIIHEKYKSKLISLEEAEKQISSALGSRLEELGAQLKTVKTLLFDAKVQFKSNEISEAKYDLIKTHTGEIMEHIDHEKAEILNIQRRMSDLSLDGVRSDVNQQAQIQTSAVSYLVTNNGQTVEQTPSAPSYSPEKSSEHANSAQPIFANTAPSPAENREEVVSANLPQPPTNTVKQTERSDWFAGMEAQ